MYSIFHGFIHITVPSCRRIFLNLLHLLDLLSNKHRGIFRTTSLLNRVRNKMKLLCLELLFNMALGVSQSFSLQRRSVSSSWAKYTHSHSLVKVFLDKEIEKRPYIALFQTHEIGFDSDVAVRESACCCILPSDLLP